VAEEKPDVDPVDDLAPIENPPPGEKVMGFLDHLEELRGTLIKSAVVLVIFVTLIGVFLKQFSAALLWPFHSTVAQYPELNAGLITTSPMAVFSVIIQLCLLGGLTMSLPFILYFVGQFVAPALTPREKKLVLPAAIGAMLLFLGGALFSYFFIVPSAIKVSIELNRLLGFELLWTADRYYAMLVWLVLGIGVTFEFPLVILILVFLEFVTVAKLRRIRRVMIIVFFVIAAIVTPTPDPLTQSLVALPMCALYEISILLAAALERKRARDRAAEEAEDVLET
jgi:sec-independent protein translocase protein TatC